MNKSLFIICILLSSKCQHAQIFELESKVDHIPLFDNNRQFMKVVNTEYQKLISEKADTILLYYPIEYTTNYAVIV